MKKIFTNDEENHDASVIYSKKIHKNTGLSNSNVITNPFAIHDNKYVLINETLEQGQVKSLCEVMPDFKHQFTQIFLSNTVIDGKQFAGILESLSKEQRAKIKSIVYGGKSSVSLETLQTIDNLYI